MMSRVLVQCVSAVALLAASLQAETKTCGDFLAEMHKKPQGAEFVSCTPHPEEQTKPLKAIYSVKGENAAAVERFLVKNFRMAPLKKSCCQWDTPPISFRRSGNYYTLGMVSDEDTGKVTAMTRDDWKKVQRFEVHVDLETDEP